MNKKFISICLSIFAISLIFILGFKFILGDKILYTDAMNFEQGEPIIEYSGFEEDKNIYKIKVRIKNNSDYIASFTDVTMRFLGDSQGAPIFNGYDNTEKEYILNLKQEDKYNFSFYLEPEEEREYAFEISKGLSFDNKFFDMNSMSISYNARYFKYRINESTVFSSAFSRSGSELIDDSLEPFTID